MNKQEALDKIDELRKFVEQEDAKPDYSQWVGKWGFYSDEDPKCHNDGLVKRLTGYYPEQTSCFSVGGTTWRYFRPVKPEEIFPELFGDYVDWSKVPKRPWNCKDWPDADYVFLSSNGTVYMQGYEPQNEGKNDWLTSVPLMPVPDDAIIGPIPPWRESLRRRPNTGT